MIKRKKRLIKRKDKFIKKATGIKRITIKKKNQKKEINIKSIIEIL